jgi:hypothetical protein
MLFESDHKFIVLKKNLILLLRFFFDYNVYSGRNMHIKHRQSERFYMAKQIKNGLLFLLSIMSLYLISGKNISKTDEQPVSIYKTIAKPIVFFEDLKSNYSINTPYHEYSDEKEYFQFDHKSIEKFFMENLLKRNKIQKKGLSPDHFYITLAKGKKIYDTEDNGNVPYFLANDEKLEKIKKTIRKKAKKMQLPLLSIKFYPI